MNSIIRKIKHGFQFVFENKYRFFILRDIGFFDNMPDELYLKKVFLYKLGYPLDLQNPQTFNEKLQWLKLYDRNPEYTTMVDKYEVKKYVADKIGEQYVIPTLGVWNSFDEIDFDALPNQFVLKCTHDSGGFVICRDKSNLDIESAKDKINKSLSVNYYYRGREWPYKNVKPRIIAEQYMEDASSDELKDYKLMCFNGKVKCSFVCSERFSEDGLKVTFYDRDWNVMPFERHYPRSQCPIAKPSSYDDMVRLAEQLSKDIPFVRVDFYEVSGKIYFGELTFYPGSGFEEFEPFEWDKTLGSWIRLPIDEKKE